MYKKPAIQTIQTIVSGMARELQTSKLRLSNNKQQ